MSQFSPDLDEAKAWLTDLAAFGCDGIIAKLKDEPYHSGDRDAMLKIKRKRSVDCVVGGFRFAAKKEKGIGSLLLGLYNKAGDLDHVGFCSGFTAQQRLDLVKKLAPLRGDAGFTGKAPGGPSRWSQGRSAEWEPLKPKLVVEVQYDHLTKGRFRHGTKFLRWRPEKAPKQCTFEQLRVVHKPKAA
jgi:ATP-dependent DNA ligase